MFMLRCKDVSKALADHRYWEMPWYKRLGMRMHIGLCVFCGPFQRQIIVLQDAVAKYLQHEETDEPPSEMRLPDDAKQQIKDALQQQSK